MQIKKVALADTRSFSSFFLDYIQQNPSIKQFYHRFPLIENFKAQIEEKAASFPKQHRTKLVSVLEEQYQSIAPHEVVNNNIKNLQLENTFTVTTGHQLNVFTGPLYFIFKIVTVINACKELRKAYPAYNFVPIYWMASEDHDYDEIKYAKVFGQKYTWQTEQHGGVGRFSTDGLAALASQIPGDTQLFKKAYSQYQKLSDAVRYYVHELFCNEGLVVLDGDHRELKKILTPVVEDDVFNHTAKRFVEKTDKALSYLGYKTQVHCRDINFFFLDTSLRSRIENDGADYKVIDTDLRFSKQAVADLIQREPEKFSPNVILRPLYQEMILPNLAYAGGPAEVIYWLQLKDIFTYYKIPFPMLMPRNFGMVMDHTQVRRLNKTKLCLDDLFLDKQALINHWVTKNATHDLTTTQEQETLNTLMLSLHTRAEKLDATLGPHVAAETKRMMDSLSGIGKKLARAEKRLHTEKIGQIEALKESLFPNGSLQERTDNILNFYPRDPQFINKLLAHFNPFDFQFTVLMQEEHD